MLFHEHPREQEEVAMTAIAKNQTVPKVGDVWSYQKIYEAIRQGPEFSATEFKFLMRLLERKRQRLWPRLDMDDLDLRPYPQG